MATDEQRAGRSTLATRFGGSLRIDEQWFEALRGETGDGESGADTGE